MTVFAGLAAAAALCALIAAPFIRDQAAALAARGDGSPIVIGQFAVLGDLFPHTLRRVLDLPAYWLVLLPIEFPATYIAGLIALVVTQRTLAPGLEKTVVAIFIALAGAGLVVSWLLVSTRGRQQRSWPARGLAGRHGADRWRGGGNDARPAS